jgi:hypothetical protein
MCVIVYKVCYGLAIPVLEMSEPDDVRLACIGQFVLGHSVNTYYQKSRICTVPDIYLQSGDFVVIILSSLVGDNGNVAISANYDILYE